MARAVMALLSSAATFSRRRVLALGAGALGLSSMSAEAAWKIVQIEGRDYVTAKSLKEFYKFPTLEQNGGRLAFRSPKLVIRLRVGQKEMWINNVKFNLSLDVEEHEGEVVISRLDLAKLIDPVLRPSYISGQPFDTVVIDPGHGGHDSGAPGVYGHEKYYALDTSLRLAAAIQRRGLKTRLTRTTDVYPSLPERVALANSIPRCIFVSIHFNFGPAAANGIETYALAPAGTTRSRKEASEADTENFNGNERDSENIALATAVHAAVLYHVKPADRGIMRDRFFLLKGLEKPAVLFEGGFVTNPTECARINDPLYRERLAGAICQGLMNYRGALRPR